MKRLMTTLLLVTLWGCAAPIPTERPILAGSGEPETPLVSAQPPLPCLADTPELATREPESLDDRQSHDRLLQTTERLMDQGKTVEVSRLIAQLTRKTTQLTLPQPSHNPIPLADVYGRVKSGVLLLGSLYKCDKCNRWHLSTATAFALTADGVVATNHHVVNHPKHAAMAALTPDGRVLVVKQVLAASETDDLAILQLDGAGLTPLPLAPEPAPAGARVRVMSHPDGRYYMLTEGIISRYHNKRTRRGSAPAMSITADYAKGSSGAAVLDERGNVVGIVSTTSSIYYTINGDRQQNLQMVVKDTVPVASLLRLIDRRP
jgi:S1-C subfamily serine protease